VKKTHIYDEVGDGYVCEICDSKSDKAGECAECEEARVKAKWCQKCEEIISEEKVDVCVKTGYICKACETESFKPGKCSKCDKAMEETTVKCRIVYECKGCGYAQYEPGKCFEDAEADCFEKPLTKTCEHSGMFPHIAE